MYGSYANENSKCAVVSLVAVVVEVLRCVVCSGGIPVTVTGTNLHVVQRPLMVIYAADGSESYSVCPAL